MNKKYTKKRFFTLLKGLSYPKSLLCPLVGQEFAESGAIVFFLGYPEQDVLHPLARVNAQGLQLSTREYTIAARTAAS